MRLDSFYFFWEGPHTRPKGQVFKHCNFFDLQRAAGPRHADTFLTTSAPFLMLPVHLIHTWPSEIWNLDILTSSAAISKKRSFFRYHRFANQSRSLWPIGVVSLHIQSLLLREWKHHPSNRIQQNLQNTNGFESPQWLQHLVGEYQRNIISTYIICPRVMCIYIYIHISFPYAYTTLYIKVLYIDIPFDQ